MFRCSIEGCQDVVQISFVQIKFFRVEISFLSEYQALKFYSVYVAKTRLRIKAVTYCSVIKNNKHFLPLKWHFGQVFSLVLPTFIIRRNNLNKITYADDTVLIVDRERNPVLKESIMIGQSINCKKTGSSAWRTVWANN